MRPIKDILKTMEYGPSPEANGDVNLWLEQHGRSFGHYINGSNERTQGQKRMICVAFPWVLLRFDRHLVRSVNLSRRRTDIRR
ncbi:hypothetical protein F9K85_13430, partial [Brucella tritici]|uniref:hypothetical protein n=1 Tax=Brucella tritici TaxID=94626 RepID=UPI00124C3E5D